MKKVYFKDLDTKTKIDIVLNNVQLDQKANEYFYEEQMFRQQEDGELMLGKDWYKYIEFHNNYNSFFLTLINWQKFIDNLDPDYLCQDGIDLYNEIIKLKKEYENIACDTIEEENRYNELEEKLENKCKDLLEICEDQLHEYENYNIEDYKDFLENEFEYNHLFEEYYIFDNQKQTVYVDLTKCFN